MVHSAQQRELKWPASSAVTTNPFYRELGIACKLELKLEKVTKIPFRFRLGSLSYTDYMEGKPNVVKPE